MEKASSAETQELPRPPSIEFESRSKLAGRTELALDVPARETGTLKFINHD